MSVAAIAAGANAGHAATEHRRLVDAAQQFEGIFLSELLKPMAKMSSALGGDDKQADGESNPDTMQSFGIESLAKTLATRGGVGIARQAVQDIEARTGAATVQKNSETGLKISGDATIKR